MATPAGDSYSAASGVTIYGGRFAPTFPANTALIGDSLTTHLLWYNWHPFFWINGLARGIMKLIANAGKAGDLVSDMLARVDNPYTNAGAPGMGGLGPLGTIFFQGGTNDARALTSIGSLAGVYTAIFAKLATYAERIVLLGVPPIGPSESNSAAKNALTIQYNTWLAAYAAANPTQFTFVNASANLRDGSGAQLPGFFQGDGIHNAGAATQQEGIDGNAALTSQLAGYGLTSPLSHDPADIYPAKPQWFTNPGMLGSSGTAGSGMTGQVVNGVYIGANGSGITGTLDITAADVGDDNQASWQDIIPVTVARTGGGESIRIASTLAGRSITAVDPAALDMVVELKLTGFDTSYFSSAVMYVQGSSGLAMTADLELKMGGGPTTKTVTLRHAMPRPDSNTNTGSTMIIDLIIAANKTGGGMGKIAFRCPNIRG